MKAVKLKPVLFTKNEIFVKPPDFFTEFEESNTEKWKNSKIIPVSKLHEHFEQKKTMTEKKKLEKKQDTEEEEVKNLTQWKRSSSPATPLLRKYTFKRQLTNHSLTPDTSQIIRRAFHPTTIAPVKKPTQNFYNQVLSIVASERFKKKKNEEQFYRIYETNIEAEEDLNEKISKIDKQLDMSKGDIRYLEERVDKIKGDIRNCNKKYEDDKKKLKDYETGEYLAMTKVNEGVSEEGKSVWFRDKMRKLKRDMHKKFLEDSEELNFSLVSAEKKLEACDFDRIKLKKQLKDCKEDMSNLYFRILKEGKDLRNEGLKWIIKALWKNGSYIPISTFPKFLDGESIIFIFKTSEKDLELEYLSRKIEEIRKEAKSHRTNSSISSHRELYQSIKSRIRDISRSVMSSPLQERTAADTKLDSKAGSSYSEIVSLREKINALNEFIKELTENEIKRSTSNYKNSPGEAEKVGLYHLIKCLVGEKVREFNKYTRNQKTKNNFKD